MISLIYLPGLQCEEADNYFHQSEVKASHKSPKIDDQFSKISSKDGPVKTLPRPIFSNMESVATYIEKVH